MKHIPMEFRHIITNDALVLVVKDIRLNYPEGIYSQRKRLTKPTAFVKEVQQLYGKYGGKLDAIKYIYRTRQCTLREAMSILEYICKYGKEPWEDGNNK